MGVRRGIFGVNMRMGMRLLVVVMTSGLMSMGLAVAMIVLMAGGLALMRVGLAVIVMILVVVVVVVVSMLVAIMPAVAVALHIGRLTVMVVMVIIGGSQRLDARGGLDHRAAIAAGADQARHPALEAQAVGHHQAGRGKLAHLRRARLEDVGVSARADQGVDLDAITADLPDQVLQDAEAGDDRQRSRVGGTGRHAGRQQGGQGGQRDEAAAMGASRGASGDLHDS